MRDVDERPNRLLYALIVLAFLAYFFAAAAPLRKELAFHPAWAADVSRDEAPATLPDSAKAFSFQLGNRYGVAASDGKHVWSRKADFDAAVSDALFIPYGRESRSLTAFAPDGGSAFLIQTEGWPVFRSGRLFLISPEMDSVSEYSRDGKPLWSYDFPFKITDFDASASLAVAGTLEGSLECVDSSGESVLSFAPGGSRIEVVLGVALDPREEAIAAVCGADRQRFVLLVRKGGAFKVQYHRYLESDYREPVTVRFTRDGRYVLYRQSEGIAVYDRQTGRESLLPVRAESFELEADPVRGLEFLFARTARTGSVVCFEPPARIIFSYTLPGGALWARYLDQSLYLGSGAVLGRIDISEE